MAIGLVQSAVLPCTQLASATTVVKAYTSNNAAGNLLVACVIWGYPTGAPVSVLDTRGNTWLLAASIGDTNGPGYQTCAIYYVESSLAGANTVTVTLAESDVYRAMVVSEWSGAATSGAIDGANGQNAIASVATDNVSSNTATTTVDGDLIIGWYGNCGGDSAMVAAPGTGFAMLQDAYGGGNFAALQSEYMLQSTAGSVAATWTRNDPAQYYTAVMAAFKPAAAAAYPFTLLMAPSHSR